MCIRDSGRAAGHFGAGADVPADEPRRGVRLAGGRGRGDADFDALRTARLRHGPACAGQRGGAQRHHRCGVRRRGAGIPRPDSLLLRRQRSDGRLRPRIHDHHPAGQCGDPHVLRAQRRAPRLGPPPAIHVCDHQHRHHQHGARCAFHLRLRLGHPRSRHRHGAGAGRVARMAVPHPFGQTRTAPFQPRHLPAQETHRARHHGHRHVAVSDEPRGVLHRHP